MEYYGERTQLGPQRRLDRVRACTEQLPLIGERVARCAFSAHQSNRHGTLAQSLLVVIALTVLSGCTFGRGRGDRLAAQLRQHQLTVTDLESQLQSTKSELQLAQRETESLRTALASQSRDNLPSEHLAAVFRAEKLRIDPWQSGGLDRDSQPGDDGVSVVISPVDGQGDLVKVAGTLRVEVLDPSLPDGQRVVAQFDADPAAARELWFKGALGGGYLVTIPWTRPPHGDKVVIQAALTAVGGQELATTHLVNVAPPTAGLAAAGNSTATTARYPATDAKPTRSVIQPTAAEVAHDERSEFLANASEVPATTPASPAPLAVTRPATRRSAAPQQRRVTTPAGPAIEPNETTGPSSRKIRPTSGDMRDSRGVAAPRSSADPRVEPPAGSRRAIPSDVEAEPVDDEPTGAIRWRNEPAAASRQLGESRPRRRPTTESNSEPPSPASSPITTGSSGGIGEIPWPAEDDAPKLATRPEPADWDRPTRPANEPIEFPARSGTAPPGRGGPRDSDKAPVIRPGSKSPRRPPISRSADRGRDRVPGGDDTGSRSRAPKDDGGAAASKREPVQDSTNWTEFNTPVRR